jgi:hypothetical protein
MLLTTRYPARYSPKDDRGGILISLILPLHLHAGFVLLRGPGQPIDSDISECTTSFRAVREGARRCIDLLHQIRIYSDYHPSACDLISHWH